MAVVASVAGFGRLASRHRVRSSSRLLEQFWALLLPGLAAPSRRLAGPARSPGRRDRPHPQVNRPHGPATGKSNRWRGGRGSRNPARLVGLCAGSRIPSKGSRVPAERKQDARFEIDIPSMLFFTRCVGWIPDGGRGSPAMRPSGGPGPGSLIGALQSGTRQHRSLAVRGPAVSGPGGVGSGSIGVWRSGVRQHRSPARSGARRYPGPGGPGSGGIRGLAVRGLEVSGSGGRGSGGAGGPGVRGRGRCRVGWAGSGCGVGRGFWGPGW